MGAGSKHARQDVTPLVYEMPELCSALRLDEQTVRKLMNRAVDPLPSLKLSEGRSGARRFVVSAIEEWLERQGSPTPLPMRRAN